MAVLTLGTERLGIKALNQGCSVEERCVWAFWCQTLCYPRAF